ncbi:hypothetical protein ILYODFUR_006116 [Ilyodon furcidens]|uniref:Aminotransferase-like plant mobile domain-containing protein n=1 Tax=Ilyodon furcidens TaxID=33524 RepID=A0ABV0URD0_9TELE
MGIRGYGEQLLVLRKFWKTIWLLRKGKQEPSQAEYVLGGELQTWIEDNVGRWKEYFHLNLDDAVLFMLHWSLSFLDGVDDYVKLIFWFYECFQHNSASNIIRGNWRRWEWIPYIPFHGIPYPEVL